MQLKRAIFKSYNGNWQNMMAELDVLSQVSGASQEEISLYMKGLNNSLSVNSRVKLCEYLTLDPDDFPELAYRPKTKPTLQIESCEQPLITPVCNKDAQWISTWILKKLKNTIY